MAMLTGVELLPLGLFSLGDLQACIEGGRNVHLVVPGAMEPALARSRLASHPALASLVFVQRAVRDRTCRRSTGPTSRHRRCRCDQRGRAFRSAGAEQRPEHLLG